MFQLLVILALLVAESTQLQCYSCANCDSSPELVTCGLGDSYCLKFQMYFPDPVVHRACAPDCTAQSTEAIFDLTCCQTNGCNAANLTVQANALSIFLTALFSIILLRKL